MAGSLADLGGSFCVDPSWASNVLRSSEIVIKKTDSKAFAATLSSQQIKCNQSIFTHSMGKYA